MVLAGLAALLAACSLDDGPPPPCPEVVTVDDAARMVKFTGTGRDLTDVLFEARVEGIEIGCVYDDDVVETQLNIELRAARGPADTERLARMRYFVAIATTDQEIVAREEFDTALPFEGNRTRIGKRELVEPRIPLAPDATGADYRVYVGFVLSPEELSYNRENR